MQKTSSYKEWYQWKVLNAWDVNDITIERVNWETSTSVLAIMSSWENKIVSPWEIVPENSTWAYIL
jgi:hypothetical protein